MTPDEVLKHEPKILSDEQRRFYFDNGYLVVANAVPPEWIERLLTTTDEMVERSRALPQSAAVFDLDPGPTAKNPRLRRLAPPVAPPGASYGLLGLPRASWGFLQGGSGPPKIKF